MSHRVFRHRRGLRPVVGLVLAMAAMFAFAGPASAHHDDDSGSDDPAGTISSFDADTAVLTIDLAGGGQVSGLVTDETRIEAGHGHEGSTDDLVAGTVVDDAILVLEDGKAVFAKVELAD